MVAAASSSSSPSTPTWQPPSIPSSIAQSFGSWLRPNHHANSGQSSPIGPSSKAATPPTTSASSSEHDLPAPPLPEDVSIPNTRSLSPPVSVNYAGRYDQLAASAELWLYSQAASPWFQGAQLANVNNPLYDSSKTAFAQMWQESQSSAPPKSSSSSSPSYYAEQRATIGTELGPGGKVGSIRWVAVDREDPEKKTQQQQGGWFGWGSHSSRPRNCLNVLEIGTPQAAPSSDTPAASDTEEETIVALHGYGAGTGFYFQNIAALASRPNSRLYAIDWLGMGRSSRPAYSVPSSAVKDDLTRVQAAESFFIDSLEDWRKRGGVEKMTLIGHSLGGYLSVAYALRHPQRVSRLVLVSPVGVGASPEYREAQEQRKEQQQQQHKERARKSAETETTFAPRNGEFIPESTRDQIDADATSIHSVEREVLDPQANSVPASESQAEKDSKRVAEAAEKAQPGTAVKPKSEAQVQKTNQPPRFSSRTRAVFGWLWEQNFSPFGLLRGSQFLGPWLMSRYTQRRFGTLPEEELKALHAYCQGIFLAKGSGEYCLAHMLRPGAWARIPMIDRIDPLPKSLPVSFIYGEHDWMDLRSGKEVVKKLKEQGNVAGTCFVVPHAGHHVYLDNPKAFDKLLARILDGKAERPPSAA